MKKQRRVFTKEFKVEAVRLSYNSGKTIDQVSKELGVERNTLNRWRKEYRGDAGQAFRGNGKRTEMEEKVWRLEREVERLKRGREILKKVVMIVSEP